MKHLILGTAGHIDHGKTSLVKALTGIDTDRLPEEKARGITIELGFAHLELPGDILCGIVDVPGHERFIRTMVAGIGGIDLVMLVIAADEGVMPQTREHLEICQLLGVKKGLVVLSKSDLVDLDWLGMVVEEVRDYLRGSFLDGAPILPFSSRNGTGVDDLLCALTRLATDAKEKKGDSPFRLPVDRVFSKTGFGTVVTGTLLSGSMKVGDLVEIVPSGRKCRIRGLQSYNNAQRQVYSGQRVAANLQGIEHADLCRGDLVVQPDTFITSNKVDTILHHLPSSMRDLKQRTTFRLHSATYEVPAQLLLFDRDRLMPGETALARLRLRQPVLLLPGDPFILRSYSPSVTVGGGRVLDPMPGEGRLRSPMNIELLNILAGTDDEKKILGLVQIAGKSGITIHSLIFRSGLPLKLIDAHISSLLSSGKVVQLLKEPKTYLAREVTESIKHLLIKEIECYLQTNPHHGGIGKEELKSRLARQCDPRFFAALLKTLERELIILVEFDQVKLPGERGAPLAGDAGIREKLADILRQCGREPLPPREIALSLDCGEKDLNEHLKLLCREDGAVKIKNDLYYAPEHLANIKTQLLNYLYNNGTISPAEFRELTGLSRKYMIPLLEYFDQEKLTIRVGDQRQLRKG